MKRTFLFSLFFLSTIAASFSTVNAANLIQVYQQALVSDPTYQQAIAQKFSDEEGVPISLSALLPSASIGVVPMVNRTLTSGPAANDSNTQRGYTATLTLTQTIFNFGQIAGFLSSKKIAKQAEATLNAALQDLMIRVSKAYFKILEDEDNLRYIRATRTSYEKQLDQVKQQYRVGLKTITDVYTAQASYESSVAEYIAAENQLDDDKENLRAITGNLYPSISRLKDSFPLLTPKPANIDDWVSTSEEQNWSIKAALYAAQSARDIIKQQFAGHLPSLNVQGIYSTSLVHNSGGQFNVIPRGSAAAHSSEVLFNLTVPLVQGGQVVAQVSQAQYNYKVATERLEKTLRDTQNLTRQSYLGVISGISKIRADRKAIQSSISSLDGMQAGYRVGTEILVNVLNQQQKVVEAQKQYATDRYAYVNNLLSLKQAAGTLSPDDLAAINAWLDATRDNIN